MSLTKSILLAAALLGSASAHMKMVQPPPFGPDSLNNSPLLADGSNFPCKNDRPDAFGPPKSTATMPIGAKQTLQLMGGATHGGGSCQISLTKDLKPTKNSKWMVIHSIEGGCPTSSAGNIGEDAGALDPTTFEYSIPEGIAPGQYALAWTWFNKVGNREMYMNCAPIVVSGGGKKRSTVPEPETVSTDELEASLNGTQTANFNLESRAAGTFPDMFIANIPASDCTTTESTDVQFPDPGQSTVTNSKDLKPPTGAKCGAAGPAGGSSGSSAAPSAPAAGGSGASGGGSSGSGSSSPSAAPPAAPPAAPASPGTATILASPSASAAAAAPAAASPSTGSSSGSTAPAPAAPVGGSCTPGQVVCSPDGKSIGECDATGHVTMGPVAGGTKCVNGLVQFARRERAVRRYL